jgi:regulator of replication initiation timing
MGDLLQPFIQEAITIAQFEDSLEERNKEIRSLKEEIVKLKEELRNVKTRNKKLCNILALGESKYLTS